MKTATEHCYIITDSQILDGEPIIRGTHTSVRAVAEMWRLGMDPADIPRILPQLSLAQVFDALSYYHDHQEQIAAYMASSRLPQELFSPPDEPSSSASLNSSNGAHGTMLPCA